MSTETPIKASLTEKEVDNLTLRLRHLLEIKTVEKGRFTWLKKQTKIGAKTWQAWWTRSSMASANMIDTIAKIWPEHAFWLATGIEDTSYGHYKPRDLGREGDQYFESAMMYEQWVKDLEEERVARDELDARIKKTNDERTLNLLIRHYENDEDITAKSLWIQIIENKAMELESLVVRSSRLKDEAKNKVIEKANDAIKKHERMIQEIEKFTSDYERGKLKLKRDMEIISTKSVNKNTLN
jgi:hypothetical protein